MGRQAVLTGLAGGHWLPRSEWCSTPGAGRLLNQRMVSASVARSAVSRDLRAQPTNSPARPAARRSATPRRRRKISPTAATATRIGSTRWSGRRTRPSRGCGPRSSTCSRWSAEVWLHQGALSGSRQERAPAVRDLRAGKSVPRAPSLVAAGEGVVRPLNAKGLGNRLREAGKRPIFAFSASPMRSSACLMHWSRHRASL